MQSRNFCKQAAMLKMKIFKTLYCIHAAILIKVVPKTREKVEYERERLIGKD